MEPLALIPENLPESETSSFSVISSAAEGELIIQFFRATNRLVIDVSLSARLGKGLLGRAELKARSEWEKSDRWRNKEFFHESSLWGLTKSARIDFHGDELDPLAVPFALRCSPMKILNEKRHFATRDQSREKIIELYVAEKKREATKEMLRIDFKDPARGGEREELWNFWVEEQTNLLSKIQLAHKRWGRIEFHLKSRHP